MIRTKRSKRTVTGDKLGGAQQVRSPDCVRGGEEGVPAGVEALDPVILPKVLAREDREPVVGELELE